MKKPGHPSSRAGHPSSRAGHPSSRAKSRDQVLQKSTHGNVGGQGSARARRPRALGSGQGSSRDAEEAPEMCFGFCMKSRFERKSGQICLDSDFCAESATSRCGCSPSHRFAQGVNERVAPRGLLERGTDARSLNSHAPRAPFVLMLIAGLAACGPPTIEEDAGVPDAGASGDAGSLDGGVPDAGPLDAGTSDAGVLCTAAGIPGTCLAVSVCIGTRMPTAGLCPGPASIQCCTPRYTNTCDPNFDPQPNLGLTSGDGGCLPPGMVRITTFCIDQFEASILEVLDGGATRPWSPYANPGTRVLRAQSVRGAVPQGYITQLQAAAACSGAGKRLCTDAECCGARQE